MYLANQGLVNTGSRDRLSSRDTTSFYDRLYRQNSASTVVYSRSYTVYNSSSNFRNRYTTSTSSSLTHPLPVGPKEYYGASKPPLTATGIQSLGQTNLDSYGAYKYGQRSVSVAKDNSQVPDVRTNDSVNSTRFIRGDTIRASSSNADSSSGGVHSGNRFNFKTSDARAGCVSYVPPTNKWQLSKTKIPKGQYFDDFNDLEVYRSGGRNIPCKRTFKEAGLSTMVMKNIAKAGYHDPTPVQRHCIPIIMAGRDLMACGQTGTGKTAAYLLPLLTSIINKKEYKNISRTSIEPLAIIVTPTRELVIQICEDGKQFAEGTSLKVESMYGGVSVDYQIQQCLGSTVIVATPGRLCHLIKDGNVHLSECQFLVLDEADQMLNIGFEPQIRQLCDNPTMKVKGQRQMSMFSQGCYSATFPAPIQQLAETYLNDFIFITVGGIGTANLDIRQVISQVLQYEKQKSLLDMLRILQNEVFEKKQDDGTFGEKVLVFVNAHETADQLHMLLQLRGYEVARIHGKLMQQDREEALNDFKVGNTMILIANAVAARGLDIKGVDQVINYDLPDTIEEYVQRIGRTGRVGNPGRATSFFDRNSKDKDIAKALVEVMSGAEQKVPTWLQKEAGQYMGSSKALRDSVAAALGGSSAGRVFSGDDVWD